MSSELFNQEFIGISISHLVAILGATSIGHIIISIWKIFWKNKEQPRVAKKDPFLRFYIFAAVLFVGLFWLILHNSTPQEQVIACGVLFIIVAISACIVAVWRKIHIITYMCNPNTMPFPVGLGERYSFWPYFILLGPTLAICLILIFSYTSNIKYLNNRMIILAYFSMLSVFLLVIRLAWEWIDSTSLQKIEATKRKGRP